MVGDRRGLVYAYELGSGSPTGTPVPGWPATDGSGPIDSTPSVTSAGPNPTIVVGSGNDADPTVGGYQAFRSSASLLWFAGVQNPPTDTQPLVGVEAGVSVAPFGSGADLVAGSLGQVSYALSASNGAPLTGWPFFNSDSTHSTAATADLYGTGRREIVVGGDQSAGVGRGQVYQNGGHLRILSSTGNQICRADTEPSRRLLARSRGNPSRRSDRNRGRNRLLLPRRVRHRQPEGLRHSLQPPVVDETRREHLFVACALRCARRRLAAGGRGYRSGAESLRVGLRPQRGDRRRHLVGARRRPHHRIGGDGRPRHRLRRRDRANHRRCGGARRPLRSDRRGAVPVPRTAERTAGDRRPERDDRDHPGGLRRVGGFAERRGRDRPLRDQRLERRGRNRRIGMADVSPRRTAHRQRRRHAAGRVDPGVLGAGRRLERLRPRRVRRWHLHLPRGWYAVLRFDGQSAPQRAGGRHGDGPGNGWLLGSRCRRRHLRLRSGRLLRFDGGPAARSTRGRNGGNP